MLTRILLLQECLSTAQVLRAHPEDLTEVGEVLPLALDEAVKVVEAVLLARNVPRNVLIALIGADGAGILLYILRPATCKGCGHLELTRDKATKGET
jgi:hypothetical protein